MWFKKYKNKEHVSPVIGFNNIMVSVPRYTDEKERYKKQGYMDFPDRDRLYYRKDDIKEYKNDPVIKRLIEHFQPFFEKGINYESDGKNYNCYLGSSNLFYFNEAFSLCTKLSIDRSPEEYFVLEYCHDMNVSDIERYFVLSIAYVLLVCNGLVRKQHLKMVDLLDDFLRLRCPTLLRTQSFLFVTDLYNTGEMPFWEFKPEIDKWGSTILNVNEGLPDNEEEQVTLINQMRQKFRDHIRVYEDMFESRANKNNSKQKSFADDEKATKVRLKALTEILKKAGMGTDKNDMTKVARLAAFITGSKYDYIYKLMSKGYDLDDKTHGKAVEEVNKYFSDLDSEIRLKCK